MANVVKLYYVDTGTTYKQWELLPNKLLVVDSIEDYLATKTAYSISNFQYVKNELEIGINVDLSQSYSQPKATTSFKYVSIQNNGESIHYYFIKKIIWRSKSAIRLELVMDVLNTFKEGTDYVFKENTRIKREHKDRFKIMNPSNRIITFLRGEGPYNHSGTLAEGDEVIVSLQVYLSYVEIFRGTITEVSDPTYKIKIADNDLRPNSVIEDLLDQTPGVVGLQIKKNVITTYPPLVFFYVGHYSYSIAGDLTLMRKVDYISENINPVLVASSSNHSVNNNKVPLAIDWYLLYRNQENPSSSLVNPVDCYLIPATKKNTNSGVIQNGRLVPSWIETGKFYYFKVEDKQATLSNGVNLDSSFPDNVGRRLLVVSKTQDKLHISYLYLNTGYIVQNEFEYDNITYIDFTNLPVLYIKKDSYIGTGNEATLYNLQDSMTDEFNNTSVSEVDPISYLDRTDAKNIKLIKLPYCPYDFTVSGTTLQIADDTNWELVSLTQANGGVIHLLKLKNLEYKLHTEIYSSLYPFGNLKVPDLTTQFLNQTLSLTDLRQEGLESKLYHSDFYSPTYYYDSFAFKMKLEKCDLDYYVQDIDDTSRVKIRFDMTSTINSKFLFTFTNYKVVNKEENYYDVMPIARNNEEVLYNVPYINYIRTGYQYDIKNKDISNISNAIGLGLSVASVGVSLLAPSVPLKAAGVVASVVSMAMSVKSTIVSAVNNENSIKQKQEQYKNQSTSVAGSDDVDLMTKYAGNRLRYSVYEPNEMMKKLLEDLFFFAGYNSGRLGLPNHNTRVNFDYLECEASIESIASIPDDCLTELINCFNTGITYLHKTDRNTDKWDFNQKYENWEKILL